MCFIRNNNQSCFLQGKNFCKHLELTAVGSYAYLHGCQLCMAEQPHFCMHTASCHY